MKISEVLAWGRRDIPFEIEPVTRSKPAALVYQGPVRIITRKPGYDFVARLNLPDLNTLRSNQSAA